MWLLTAPVYIGIGFVRFFSYTPVLRDFDCCKIVVEEMRYKFASDISETLILTLFVAEDHRNHSHYGVDPVAIVRALVMRFFYGKKQGASTVEQQLVRTITQRYEKTPRRKVREQMLAVMLGAEFKKTELAAAYLKLAYYGGGLVGGHGIRRLRVECSQFSDEAIVAHLKYPRPLVYSERLREKHKDRMRHIRRLISGEIKLLFRTL
ncbi:transglycosylase domain-containing protein [Pseudomonas sp. M5A4_2d]